MSVYIVVNGSPVDGFTHTGPFDTHEEALEWAEQNIDFDPWWVTELENPNA